MHFLGSINESGPYYQRWHAALDLMQHRDPYGYAWMLSKQLAPYSSASIAICALGFYEVLSAWWSPDLFDVSLCNAEGESLLVLNAHKGFLPVCKRLIELGARVNAPGEYHGTTLQAASLGVNKTVLRLLLDHGADANAPGGRYGTALQAASSSGHETVVQLLLNNGATGSSMNLIDNDAEDEDGISDDDEEDEEDEIGSSDDYEENKDEPDDGEEENLLRT